MQAGCNLMVTHSLFTRTLQANTEALKRYWQNLCKSYTDDNRLITWCSRKGCEHCIKKSNYTVHTSAECLCGIETCLQCGAEKHAPCMCHIASLWEEKATSE